MAKKIDLADHLITMQTLQAVLDVVANPVLIKDREHRTLLVNRSACETFERSAESLIGLTEHDMFPADLADVLCEINERVFETGRDDQREEQIPDKTGEIRTIDTHKSVIVLADGSRLLVLQINDVTAYRRAEAQARFLALHDPLTGLPNRTLLQDRLEQAIACNRRQQSRFALLYLDVDRFKYVNDSFGHQAGDAFLTECSQRLKQAVRAIDTVARLGGDEFAIIVAEIESDRAVIAVCDRIIESARLPVHIDGQTIRTSASVGVALSGAASADGDELHRCADVALYRAKKSGRDCFHIYDAGMDKERRQRSAIEAGLSRAMITMDELEVHYQPLVSNKGHKLVGMEALVRWKSSELGHLSPVQFIPIAEETGLIAPLGDWVLKQACTMLASWGGIGIAINISPVQLRDSGLAQRVLGILREKKVNPQRLQLEITESAILNADPTTLQTLEQLRAVGVQVALDDFGTGYSSLTHLHNFNVDRIKIDRSFIRHLGDCVDSEAIVRAVLSIGEALELAVTAEGVETEEQCTFLSTTSCAELQGYFFSRPLSPADTKTLLADAFGS